MIEQPGITFSWNLDDGTAVAIRPIRPADSLIEQEFVRGLSTKSKTNRFFAPIKELSAAALKAFTQTDYPASMALIATISPNGIEREIGVARYAPAGKPGHVEFAVVVADDWQGKGIATQLLRHLFELAENAGVKSIEGFVLRENEHMLALIKEFGFESRLSDDDPSLRYVRKDI